MYYNKSFEGWLLVSNTFLNFLKIMHHQEYSNKLLLGKTIKLLRKNVTSFLPKIYKLYFENVTKKLHLLMTN